MGLLEALQKYIDAEEAKDPEIIDGTNIKDVLDVVDLSIAHSPVIPFRAPDHVSPAESLRGAVEAIETEGGGYILRDCPTMTHPVSADALKRMRARYLLTRGAVMRPSMDGSQDRDPPHRQESASRQQPASAGRNGKRT